MNFTGTEKKEVGEIPVVAKGERGVNYLSLSLKLWVLIIDLEVRRVDVFDMT